MTKEQKDFLDYKMKVLKLVIKKNPNKSFEECINSCQFVFNILTNYLGHQKERSQKIIS